MVSDLSSSLAPPGGLSPRIGILQPGQSMQDYIGHSVINLSDKTLSPDQLKALSKGLTFCPTPWEPDMASIITNLEAFFRKMRLKVHFLRMEKNAQEAEFLTKLEENKGKRGRKKTTSFTQVNIRPISQCFTPTQSQTPVVDMGQPKPTWKSFMGKSTFNPPSTDPTLESFCRQVKFDTLKSPVKKIRWSNLTKEERAGLDELEKDSDLTIKKQTKAQPLWS